MEWHSLMADALNGVVCGPENAIERHVLAAWVVLRDWLIGNNWTADDDCKRYVEVSLAYCPRTATARLCAPPDLENHIYPDLRPDEIGGTADLIVVPNDKTRPILVLDHKTGMWGDFSNPAKLAQLEVLGIAACLKWGRHQYVPAVLHSPKDGIPIVYESEPQTAGYGGAKFRAQIDRVGDGSMRPGAWCKTCPVRTQCPTQHAELLSKAGELVEKANLVGSELVLVGNNSAALSREEKIGRLHMLIARFRELDEAAIRETKRALREDPSLEPIRPDGKVLRLGSRTVERISKSSIVRALGAVEGGKMLDKLREMGALEEKEEEVLWAK